MHPRHGNPPSLVGFEIFADEAGRISYKDLPNRFAQPFDFQVFCPI